MLQVTVQSSQEINKIVSAYNIAFGSYIMIEQKAIVLAICDIRRLSCNLDNISDILTSHYWYNLHHPLFSLVFFSPFLHTVCLSKHFYHIKSQIKHSRLYLRHKHTTLVSRLIDCLIYFLPLTGKWAQPKLLHPVEDVIYSCGSCIKLHIKYGIKCCAIINTYNLPNIILQQIN